MTDVTRRDFLGAGLSLASAGAIVCGTGGLVHSASDGVRAASGAQFKGVTDHKQYVGTARLMCGYEPMPEVTLLVGRTFIDGEPEKTVVTLCPPDSWPESFNTGCSCSVIGTVKGADGLQGFVGQDMQVVCIFGGCATVVGEFLMTNGKTTSYLVASEP